MSAKPASLVLALPMALVACVMLDLRAKTLTTAVAPLGEPLPAPRTTSVRGDPSGVGAIRAIELGSAPGIEAPAVGAVWIDDLVIDGEARNEPVEESKRARWRRIERR